MKMVTEVEEGDRDGEKRERKEEEVEERRKNWRSCMEMRATGGKTIEERKGGRGNDQMGKEKNEMGNTRN